MKVATIGSASRQAMHRQPLGGELKIKATGSKVSIGGTKIEPQLRALEHSIHNLFNNHYLHVIVVERALLHILRCRFK